MQIYNTKIHPHKNTIKRKRNHTTILTGNHADIKPNRRPKISFAPQPDKFYLTYIYMFICVTANKKNEHRHTTQIATRNFTIQQHHHHHIQIKHHPHKQIQINKISSHARHTQIYNFWHTTNTHITTKKFLTKNHKTPLILCIVL